MRMLVLTFVAILAGCASPAVGEQARSAERGLAIAQTHCSTCHAIGAVGESRAPEAPPFRTLSRNYRVESLEEALAEGISVGHPAMPPFTFDPNDVDALILYLQSIQETGAS